MVTLEIEFEEDELLEILSKYVDNLVNESDKDIIIKYFKRIIKDQTATFFYGPSNLKEWVKGSINALEVIHPYDSQYEHYCELWDSESFDLGNKSLVERLNNKILVDHY